MLLLSRRQGAFAALVCAVAACSTHDINSHARIQAAPSSASSAAASQSAVEALLAQMTLEEKVGQMTQLTMSMFAPATLGKHQAAHIAVDHNKLREAIEQWHVGSLFNVVDTRNNSDETAAAWRDLMAQLGELNQHHSRLKIPILFGIDAVHGANYTRDATLFAHPIGQAATFDRELVAAVARTAAHDVAASGIAWNFSPDLDVARHPLWSRMYETFGESPWVVRELGRSAVQAHTASLSCAKHYLGYGATRTGHDRDPGVAGVRTLREVYLPPFAAAVAAGVPAIMVNSGTLEGEPLCASHLWLTEVLRNELHFEGVVVTDWEDLARLYTRDRVAASPKDAVRIGILAGIDMSMVPEDYAFSRLLIELVREGQVPMARIDQAVRRILRLKEHAHLIGSMPPQQDPAVQPGVVGAPADRALSLEVANRSMTLLKNDKKLLPLSRHQQILVTGPAANSLATLSGGWTHTWQGNIESHYDKEGPTILEALREAAGADHVTYRADLKAAVAAAKSHDVAVVCIGERPYTEWFGDIDDLTLDAEQLALAQAIERTGVPVVLVLVEGRPRVVRPIVDKARAVLLAYLPGYEGGRAIAQTLMGHNNPSGRLPMTYPRATGALRLHDHGWAESHFDRPLPVEWPFGAGLSYTEFQVDDVQVPKTIALGAPVQISAQVTNTGAVAGRHTVLLRLRDRYASLAPATSQIRGFAQVELAPQQKAQVHFELTPYDLSFVGRDLHRVVEPGDFDVFVDEQEASFRVTGEAQGPLRL